MYKLKYLRSSRVLKYATSPFMHKISRNNAKVYMRKDLITYHLITSDMPFNYKQYCYAIFYASSKHHIINK